MIFHNSNEEYPQPLSMFSEDEWKGMGNKVTLGNWNTIFKNTYILEEEDGIVFFRVLFSDGYQLINICNMYRSNLYNRVEAIESIIKICEKYRLDDFSVSIKVKDVNKYDEFEVPSYEWVIISIIFYFYNSSFADGFYGDRDLLPFIYKIGKFSKYAVEIHL